MQAITLTICLLLAAAPISAQTPAQPQPDATTIMSQVAANQDCSAALRSHYIYIQHARVISRKGSTVRCEETTDARVVPSATGSTQQILKLDGRLLVKNHYITYTHLPDPKDTGDTNIDNSDDNLTINLDNNGTMDRDLVETCVRASSPQSRKTASVPASFPSPQRCRPTTASTSADAKPSTAALSST